MIQKFTRGFKRGRERETKKKKKKQKKKKNHKRKFWISVSFIFYLATNAEESFNQF
jgi:hypothetical protein